MRRAARAARKEARRSSRASSSTSTSHDPLRHPKPPGSPPPNPNHRYREDDFDAHLRDLAAQDAGRASEFDAWETGSYGTGLGWGDEPYSGQRIPKRWAEREGNVWNDPIAGGAAGAGGQDEESYAEEIRQGMWARKNPDAVKRGERLAEEAKRTAERLESGRREQERKERKRIEKLERGKGEKQEKRWEVEREEYERQWRQGVLVTEGEGKVRWRDVPWPVYRVEEGMDVRVEELTLGAVREFLLPPSVFWKMDEDEGKKRKREVLREAIRRSAAILISSSLTRRKLTSRSLLPTCPPQVSSVRPLPIVSSFLSRLASTFFAYLKSLLHLLLQRQVHPLPLACTGQGSRCRLGRGHPSVTRSYGAHASRMRCT